MKPKISKHISYNEATHSYTAKRYGIDNTPNDDVLKNMRHTAHCIFEPLRAHFGEPIKINSFYRSKKLNRKIGGTARSQHITGEAMDLDDTYGRLFRNKNYFDYIRKNLDFDQLIWEFGDDNNPDWVHVSCRANINRNRHQVLRSFRRNGKTIYQEWQPRL